MSISNPQTSLQRFPRIGGILCLDFANTLRGSSTFPHRSRDTLNSYADLVEWGLAMRELTDKQAKALLEDAQRRTQGAEAVLKQAIVLREAIDNLFSTMANEKRLPEKDLRTLNTFVVPAYAQRYLKDLGGERGCYLEWVDEPIPLNQIILRVAMSAVDSLSSYEFQRVRQCSEESCGRLFLDLTNNRSRRWCSMGECGNRAKIRRHRQRKREPLSGD